MKSLHYILVILLVIAACSKKEDPAIANEIVFVRPSTTNTIMISPGQTVNFEVKLTAQNKVSKLEGYSSIDNQPASIFLTKEFTNNSLSETYSGSYLVPANAPNYTNGELEFRLYDKSSASPIKTSKLSIMIH